MFVHKALRSVPPLYTYCLYLLSEALANNKKHNFQQKTQLPL